MRGYWRDRRVRGVYKGKNIKKIGVFNLKSIEKPVFNGFVIDQSVNERYYGGYYKDKRTLGCLEREDSCYFGEFLNGEKEGFGVLEEKGVKYKGFFKKGVKNGLGAVFYSEGKVLKRVGVVDNGIWGFGEVFLRDGSVVYCDLGCFMKEGPLKVVGRVEGLDRVYEGELLDWEIEGFGVVYKGGRKVYEGEFRKGVYSGYGVLYGEEEVIGGVWVDGRMQCGWAGEEEEGWFRVKEF